MCIRDSCERVYTHLQLFVRYENFKVKFVQNNGIYLAIFWQYYVSPVSYTHLNTFSVIKVPGRQKWMVWQEAIKIGPAATLCDHVKNQTYLWETLPSISERSRVTRYAHLLITLLYFSKSQESLVRIWLYIYIDTGSVTKENLYS